MASTRRPSHSRRRDPPLGDVFEVDILGPRSPSLPLVLGLVEKLFLHLLPPADATGPALLPLVPLLPPIASTQHVNGAAAFGGGDGGGIRQL